MSSAVSLLSTASFTALSAASFPQILTCPGTHIKTISLWSALILCKSSCISISRGWSVFNFPSACKANSESEKNHESPSLRLIGLFKSKQNCLQLRFINRTVVFQSTWGGAIWGNRWHCCSSNLLIHFWAVGTLQGLWCLLKSILSKIDLRFKLIQRRDIWHCGVAS